MLIGLVSLVLLAGLWLFNTLSEVGLEAFLTGKGGHASTVKLKTQPVYRVKKKLDLLGMKVIRIISKQQPQEFLILEGVSSKLVDKFFAKEADLAWTNLMANQFLRLREAGEGDSSPVSVEIQALKTLQHGTVERNKSALPYWQLEIRFKLSNEPNSRYYQAGVIRNADNQSRPSGQETLLIGYAQKEAFQKQLITDLMDKLTFEQN